MNLPKIAALALTTFTTHAAWAQESAWNYDDTSAFGPASWGSLAEEFHACSSGLQQSPVDLASSRHGHGVHLRAQYSETPFVVENNGRTIEVPYTGDGKLSVRKEDYRLVQFHFHTPSEHRAGGHAFPAEAHFVHMNGAGQLAVIGVFLRIGAANETFDAILHTAPEDEGEHELEGAYLDPKGLMPSSLANASYAGSLTTPPCSEGVRWFVLRETVEVSAAQIHKLRELVEHASGLPVNARPVQPLNGRVISHHPSH